MELTINGHRAYAYTGARAFDASVPTVMLVHGAGLDHSVWILQSRYLAHHGFNVLAVDTPGHGRSGGDPLSSIDDMAQWCVCLADALDTERFAICGHSMGSLIALRAAAQHPQRIQLLGLLAIAAPMTVAPPLLEAARSADHAAIDMVNIWGHAYASRLGGNSAPGMWMSGCANRLLECGPNGVLFNDLNACNEYKACIDDARRVTATTLVLLGQQDVMASPRSARDLIAALPQPCVHEISHCGHMLMAEQPDVVLNHLYHALTLAFAESHTS